MSPATPVRVLLAGADGRMGRVCRAALEAADDLVLADTLVRGDAPGPRLDPSRVDVLLDFTLADTSRALAPAAARAGLRPVVGTSGLTADDLLELATACGEGNVGGLVVPNFSVGAVLQMQACERAAAHMRCAGLHEEHHPGKRDAPSGTARATAERIAAARPDGAAPPITSARREGVLAVQRVTFTADAGEAAEELVLEHRVTDRAAYVPGILLALRRVGALDELVVGLDALLADGDGLL